MRSYLANLADAVGQGWNRFWFTTCDPVVLSVLRILTGVAALYYLLGFIPDLVKWFGPHGLLPMSAVRALATPPGAAAVELWRWSYLEYFDSPAALWVAHVAAIVVALLFTLGAWSRLTNILTVIVLLSYVHRGPMLTGPFESVLTMLAIYLCIGPSGACCSFDAWRRVRTAGAMATVPAPSCAANISLRLIQVHLAGLYLMMGLNQLAGWVWWSGEAMWSLMARTESRLIDWTFLHTHIYLINMWTFAVVICALLFAVLVWNRFARPLLLVATTISWLLLIPVTGQVGYCMVMIFANAAFVSPGAWHAFASRWRKPAAAGALAA